MPYSSMTSAIWIRLRLHLLEKAAHLFPLWNEERGPDDPLEVEFIVGAEPSEEDVFGMQR